MRNDPFGYIQAQPQGGREPRSDFDEFEATELYCPKCRQAVQVRKFLLLILPDGDRYEYRCRSCGTKVGDKIDHSGQFQGVLRST